MQRIRVWILALSFCASISGCRDIQASREHDCNEWYQTFEEYTQRAWSGDNQSPFNPLDGMQGHIAWLRRSAEFDKQAATLFRKMRLRDANARQIRRDIVSSIEAISKSAHNQAERLEDLPDDASLAMRQAALQEDRSAMREAGENLQQAVADMNQYCTAVDEAS